MPSAEQKMKKNEFLAQSYLAEGMFQAKLGRECQRSPTVSPHPVWNTPLSGASVPPPSQHPGSGSQSCQPLPLPGMISPRLHPSAPHFNWGLYPVLAPLAPLCLLLFLLFFAFLSSFCRVFALLSIALAFAFSFPGRDLGCLASLSWIPSLGVHLLLLAC